MKIARVLGPSAPSSGSGVARQNEGGHHFLPTIISLYIGRRVQAVLAVALVVIVTIFIGPAQSAGAATTVIVVSNLVTNRALLVTGSFLVLNQAGSTTSMIAPGPSTPPLGYGSLQLSTSGSTPDKVSVYNYDQGGTTLASLTTLSYSTYTTSTDPNLAPLLQMEIFRNGTSGYSTLSFEPYLNSAEQALAQGTWQTWNVLSGTVWATGLGTGPGSVTNPVSWSTFLGLYPNAEIKYGFGVDMGSGWSSAATSAVDDLTIATATSGTTFNFDAPPTLSVSSSSSSSTYAQSTTFTATLSPNDGSGTVAFSEGGTGITGCSAQTLSLIGGSYEATCSTSTLPVGTTAIAVAYSGNGNYANAAGSLVGGQTVNQAPTVTSLSSSIAPTIYAQSTTFTATLSPNDGSGTVAFLEGGTGITGCSAQTLSLIGGAYQATCATSTLPVGTTSITTAYSGDTNYTSSGGSLSGGQTVNQASTTTSLSSSPSPSNYGQSTRFTAVVSPNDGSGTVSFSAAGTVIARCSAQTLSLIGGAYQATCATSTLPLGTTAIAVAYSGDPGYISSNGSLSGGQTVNRAPTSINLSTSLTPSTFGQSTTFTATVSPNDGSGTVSFSAAGTTIAGCDSQPLSLVGRLYQASCSTASLPAGATPISANYSGDSDYTNSSGSLAGDQSVNVAVSSTSLSSAQSPTTFGQSTTFTAVVSPNDGSGTVSFSAAGTAIAGCAAQPLTFVGANYQASCATSTLPVGTTAISANYSGDTNFAGSSGSLTGGQSVNMVVTSMSVSSSINPSVYGQSTTFQATVSPNDGTGTVSFSAGGGVIAGCAAQPLSSVGSSYQANCPISTLPVGTVPITANYNGDGNFTNSAASLAGDQTVNAAAPPPVGVTPDSLGVPSSATTTSVIPTTLTQTSNGASAVVFVPPDALPSGTIVSVFPVTDTTALATSIPTGQSVIVSFAVAWQVPAGTSPVAIAQIVMTVSQPGIVAGDVVYEVTSKGLKAVGTATTNGTVTIRFTNDPTFVVAAMPKLTHVSSTVKVVSNGVRLTMGCTTATSCHGVATLSTTRTSVVGKKTVRTQVIIASVNFSMKAGTTKVSVLKVTNAGKAAVGRQRTTRRTGMNLVTTVVGGERGVWKVFLT